MTNYFGIISVSVKSSIPECMEFGSCGKAANIYVVFHSLRGGRGKLILKRSKFTGGEGRLKSLKCSRFNSVPFNHLDCMNLILADTKLRKTETRWCSQRFLYWSFKAALTHLKRGKTQLCEESANKLQPVSEKFQSTEVLGSCMVTVTGKHNILWNSNSFLH